MRFQIVRHNGVGSICADVARRHVTFQVRVEERDDPAAGVLRGRLVVAGMGDPRQDGNDVARLIPGLVQEGVPGIRVHLKVMVDPERRECPVEPLRRGLQEPVPGPEAGHDRAGPAQGVCGLLADQAVVDA